MFQLNYGYFRIYWNRYRACRIKKNIEGATSLQKISATMVAWLRKIVCWNRLQWLEILLTFGVLADVSLHYDSFSLKIGFFKELLKANLSFRIFQLTEEFGV